MQDVTAAIIRNNGRVLLACRALGEKHAGYWEFPGGKVEAGETPEDCLQRELKEEFGIDTQVKERFTESVFEYSAGKIRLLAFNVDIVDGVISLKVHSEIQWVKHENLINFNLLPADIPIAIRLKEDN